MDLYDAGHGRGVISTQLHIPLPQVVNVIRMYDASDAPDRAYALRCRIASVAYVAAVKRTGGCFR